jgi:hypothetical protein
MCKLLPGPLKYWVPWHEAKQAVHMRSVKGLDELTHAEVSLHFCVKSNNVVLCKCILLTVREHHKS